MRKMLRLTIEFYSLPLRVPIGINLLSLIQFVSNKVLLLFYKQFLEGSVWLISKPPRPEWLWGPPSLLSNG